MRRLVFAFLAGALFVAGLVLGGMTQPRKVRGFLDVTGPWDASLAFVMLGAVGVYALLYRRSLRRTEPWCGGQFARPAQRGIDLTLLLGAALFGVGWGLVGLCPGPAVAALATGNGRVIVFVAAMLLGMWLVERGRRRVASSAEPRL
jgi:uncharacterized membrane protein YedE/YeeE